MTKADLLLHHGEALDWLASDAFERGTIDAFIFDPPYCAGGFQEAKQAGAKSQGKKGGAPLWFASDNMGTAGLLWLLRQVASAAHLLLKDGGHLITFSDWRQSANIGPALESAGLRWRSKVIWDKGTPGLGEGFRAQYEEALHFVKGSAKWHNGTAYGNVMTTPRTHHTKTEHPTEKPIELMRALIDATVPPGGVVVDPFMGAGSTGVAALQTGRRFMGCEREDRYFTAAAARMAAAGEMGEGQGELFGG